jgi:hypothetical protein
MLFQKTLVLIFCFLIFFLSGVEQNRRLYEEYSGTKKKYTEHSNRFYKSIVFEQNFPNVVIASKI